MHQHTGDPGRGDVLVVVAGPAGPATVPFPALDGRRATPRDTAAAAPAPTPGRAG
ncbi:hypothetical protein ACH4F6_21400 [Streptomyces sp. NPDC017936]|uniref:hypothetical protein n=1 Tax=Streptomyces sp. NPDC017936 TaxID=3365016 RepID=UPI0037B485D0